MMNRQDAAEVAVATSVYYCLICGPCMREHISEDDTITIHDDVPHPPDLEFDEEERMQ